MEVESPRIRLWVAAIGSVMLAILVPLMSASCTVSAYVPPILTASGELTYPGEALEARIQGHVTLSYDIDANGRVENITVVDSSPTGLFEQAAVAYLSTWRFQPAKRSGEAVRSERRESTIRFSLSEPDPSYAPYLSED